MVKEVELPIKVKDKKLLTLSLDVELAKKAMIHWTRSYQSVSKAFWERAIKLHDLEEKDVAYGWNPDDRIIFDPFERCEEA